METKIQNRYSDEELEEFRLLINEKLAKATKEYDELRSGLMNDPNYDAEDTTRTFNNVMDESSSNLSRSEARQLMQRQIQFIEKLRAALNRIDNKTYGICRVTGKLIPKERLRAVPHATLSIEAKQK